MELNKEIYKKALKIMEEKKSKANYYRICLIAGICPSCGNLLRLSETKSEVECPNKCSLVSPVNPRIDGKHIELSLYHDCANSNIEAAHMFTTISDLND